MGECSHFNWTILGNEKVGLLNQTEVTCRDCNQQVSFRTIIVQMNVRIMQLEAKVNENK